MGLEAGFHAGVDASEFFEVESVEALGEVLGLDHDESVGLLEVGGKFGQESVGGEAYGACEAGRDLVSDGSLHLVGEFQGIFWLHFIAEEAESHFIDAANTVDWEDGLDGFQNAVVIVGVEGVFSRDDDDFWAEAFGFSN